MIVPGRPFPGGRAPAGAASYVTAAFRLKVAAARPSFRDHLSLAALLVCWGTWLVLCGLVGMG